MGAEHKPPLFAFVIVLTVGAIVMAYAARSEALRDEVRERTVVVAGSVLDEVMDEPGGSTDEVAAPVEPVAATSDGRDRDGGTDSPARSRGAEHGRDRERSPEGRAPASASEEAGRGKGHGGRGHAHAPGQAGGPGHGQELGHHGAKGPDKADRADRAGGHHKAKATGHHKTRIKGHHKTEHGHGHGRGKGHGKHH